MAASPSERITWPGDLTDFARESDRRLAQADPRSGVVALDSVPWLAMTHDQLLALPLDQRHGFILSLVDGRCTIEMLVDISGFGRATTITLVAELVGFGALILRAP